MTSPDEQYPYFDSSREWNGIDPTDPEQAEVVRLAKELDRYAQVLNPEYASGLADHCFIDYGSTDRQGVQTRFSFEASRIRSDDSDSLLNGTTLGSAYIVTKVMSYMFEEFDMLPAFVKELLESEDTTLEELIKSEKGVKILFEQKTILDTDGDMKREYSLAFDVGDDVSILVMDETGSDVFKDELEDLGIAVPSEEESLDISFSEEELIFLMGALGADEQEAQPASEHETEPASAAVAAIRRIYSKAAAALDLSPERQRTAVRDIVARLPVPAGPRTV